MGIIRPATPGFIVTLVATILLAVVSFCVPYFKSVFFLKASLATSGQNGSITFGTLGYCLELNGNTTCSKPTVGYELDINSLVGNKLPIEIPQVVVKWLTYALVLHIVALALAAGSALFGLLAHVREMSMTCCSTCVSGFAAAVTLLAFIFDLAFFFVAKARINQVQGGSAQIGNAIWLTLAAWIMLFFSGCFYTLGRCCIQKRGPRGSWSRGDPEHVPPPPSGGFAEQHRLAAVKAEADRKNYQKAQEVGLPAFHETQPLTGRVEGDSVYADEPSTPVAGATRRPSEQAGYAGRGYYQAPAGTRAVDEYYNPTQNNNNSYPPQPQGPRRENSAHTGYAPSTYAPSTYTYNQPNAATTSAPPLPASTNQFLAAGNVGGAYPDRYGTPDGRDYGHTAGGTTYHSAHSQYPSNYSQYDPYSGVQHNPEPSFNAETYNQTALMALPSQPQASAYAPPSSSSSSPYYTPTQQQPERSYTLGGGGYGENTVPALNERSSGGYLPYPGQHSSPSPIDTHVAGYTSPPSAHQGARTMSPDGPPPGYDAGTGGVDGHWGKH